MDVTRAGTISAASLKPKRHHGYSVVLFILGSLLPPLAVAARFGIGKDFFVNVLCTVCGYIPGHFHNFYIQNIRNNKNARRTPKWAVRYGLVDDTALKRRAKRREWATRFNERTPHSALEGQAYEEGQIPDHTVTPAGAPGEENGRRLWSQSDEPSFYGQPDASGSVETTSGSSSHRGGRWHYPANFDDAEPGTPRPSKSRKEKKEKKDRWARTEDAYNAPPTKRKKSKSRKPPSNGDVYSSADPDAGNSYSYGPNDPILAPTSGVGGQQREDEGLSHQF